MNFSEELASQFGLQKWQTEKVIELIDEGNTIPFIARYRKEAHGSLDDQTLREISERLEYLRSLEKRREEVAAAIEEAGAMTEELSAALDKGRDARRDRRHLPPVPPEAQNARLRGKGKGPRPACGRDLRAGKEFAGAV